ncbi:MAG: hypothetical protein JWM57_3178, partial [Phycisphaerales bacterium]|nr:hypothetical protein [Phycisphaerales bacterium]
RAAMKSVRGRITLWLSLAMVALSALTGTGLFVYLHKTMLAEFDRSLAIRVHTLRSLVTQKPDGTYDVDIHASALPEYAKASSGEFYRLTDSAGLVLASSVGDTLREISPPEPGHTLDAMSPTGTRLRITALRYTPDLEDEDRPAAATTPAARPALLLVAARSRTAVDAQMDHVAIAIVLAVTALSVAALGSTLVITRSSLAALDDVAKQMATVNFNQPGAQFDPHAAPAELKEVVHRFNAMLQRVADTLARERRFTADVAHELRTPIAELRSAVEVAQRFPSARSSDRAIDQAGEIALQMQTLVTTLLAIVRGETVAQTLEIRPLNLHSAVERVLRRHDMPHLAEQCDAAVLADPALLQAALENAIGNALHYASDPTSVAIRCETVGDEVILAVENDQNTLTEADLSHLFEPFWRKDAARSDGQHAGLGLSLTQTYCRAMNIDISVSIPRTHRFRIAFTFARAAGEKPRTIGNRAPERVELK